jgi:hypothetical protein
MLKIKNQIRFIAFFVLAAALLIACGGGSDGGGNSNDPDPVEPNVPEQVMGAITSGRIVSTMVSQLSQNISPIRPDQNALYFGTIDDKGACSVSGTNSVSMNWQGPDPQDISDCQEVFDLSATLNLDECVQQDKPQTEQTMALTVFKDGSLCQPDNIYAEVSNLHVIDTSNGSLNFKSGALQIDITEIAYSYTNDFMTHANVAISGDARGARDNMRYAARFNNFVQIIDTQDNHNFTAEFSGRIQSDCMNQWAAIRTITPIQFRDQNCPTQGEIEITAGDESISVRYQSDGSVTVGDTTYGSCRQLEGACNG